MPSYLISTRQSFFSLIWGNRELKLDTVNTIQKHLTGKHGATYTWAALTPMFLFASTLLGSQVTLREDYKAVLFHGLLVNPLPYRPHDPCSRRIRLPAFLLPAKLNVTLFSFFRTLDTNFSTPSNLLSFFLVRNLADSQMSAMRSHGMSLGWTTWEAGCPMSMKLCIFSC